MADPTERILIADGTEITVDVLRWDEGWDFDCPVCVIRPIIRFSPNGESADAFAESLAEDAAFDGVLEGEPLEDGILDRQFRFAVLERRWREAWRGKTFRDRHYTASRYRVRFHPDAEGELTYTMSEVQREARNP